MKWNGSVFVLFHLLVLKCLKQTEHCVPWASSRTGFPCRFKAWCDQALRSSKTTPH